MMEYKVRHSVFTRSKSGLPIQGNGPRIKVRQLRLCDSARLLVRVLVARHTQVCMMQETVTWCESTYAVGGSDWVVGDYTAPKALC
jgi:hypothetical protein